MKHRCFLTAVVTIALLTIIPERVVAQTNESQTIAFLKDKPSKNINECTGQDLMNLLTDAALDWVESIECENVKIEAGKFGVIMYTSGDTGPESYIKLNFKSDKLMKVFRVKSYGSYMDNANTMVSVYCNDEMIYENKFGISSNINSSETTTAGILDKINGKSSTIQVPSITNQENLAEIPMKSLKIVISKSNNAAINKDQIIGFRIFYRGTIDGTGLSEIVIPTGIDEKFGSEENKPVEYYDIMGCRLPQPPSKGIYIRKRGSKVEKLTAHSF